MSTTTDAAMLPLGTIRQVGSSRSHPSHTRLTPDEQRTMLILWCIARSPLIIGGDLTKLDNFTLSPLTNDESVKLSISTARAVGSFSSATD